MTLTLERMEQDAREWAEVLGDRALRAFHQYRERWKQMLEEEPEQAAKIWAHVRTEMGRRVRKVKASESKTTPSRPSVSNKAASSQQGEDA